MQNIVSYVNTFLSVIFGNTVRLLTPSETVSWITTHAQNSNGSLENFIVRMLGDTEKWFSIPVWIFFAILSFNLLLVFPYKWIRSVIRRCRVS